MKIHLEKNLEEERQILLQQQKICRNRARKYFMESNRRRKAFEDKRKEQEEKEYQIREHILQQRKQKFEEVTEKFQRAHVPLSQRRRAVFKKPVPPLEEALKQIQESNLNPEVNVPFSHRPTINWRALDSALSSALSNDKPRKHLISRTNCDKEIKENSTTNMAANKNKFQVQLEETQKRLEEQHLSSLQKFYDEVNHITNSETLSSIDSLEAGEREEVYLPLPKDPSAQGDSAPLISANLQSTNLNCFNDDKLFFSKVQHINNWLTNLDAHQTVTPPSDIFSKPAVRPSQEHSSTKEQSPCAASGTVAGAASAARRPVVFVYSPPVAALRKKEDKASGMAAWQSVANSGAGDRERGSGMESPALPLSRTWATPHSVAQRAAAPSDQRKLAEFTQGNGTASAPTSFVPRATAVFPPSNRQCARTVAMSNMHIKEIDPVQCSDKLDELESKQEEKVKDFSCNKEELPFFSDSFQATSVPQNPDSKDKQQRVSLSNMIVNYDLLDQHKKMKYDSQEQGIRFLKSILKKDSKCKHDYLQTLITNQGFKFRNEKAAVIRDSIELTKEREKGAEIPKMSKKLRWFDETGDAAKKAEDSGSLPARAGAPPQAPAPSDAGSHAGSGPAQPGRPEDRKNPQVDSVSEDVAHFGASGADHVPLNCCTPAGYNFIKQAWAASKKEERRAPAQNGGAKAQTGSPARGPAEATTRGGAAKAGSTFVYVNRKGTVIQTQCVSKANAFAQTRGRLLIPHPPPKPTSALQSGENIHVCQHPCEVPGASQSTVTQSCCHSKSALPAEPHPSPRSRESGASQPNAHSDLATVMPSPPSYHSAQCHTCTRASPQGGAHHPPASPGCEGRYPPVTLRHTKEHPVPSWKKENAILCQSQRAAGGSVTRRKRIVDNKRRNLLEQKRKIRGHIGQKYNEQMINFGQNFQLTSSEPQRTKNVSPNLEEVSDSTFEFLMAENLVKASLPEDEILTVLNSKQPQTPSLALSKTQQCKLSALSAEEQKILHSLEHLDERLHYVQEIICRNPSIRNTLQLIPVLNSQPRASPPSDVGSRLQRKY
ncbi:centrosomal protein of 126 kDa [Perognathus longimembris pacificus]|uniref:centrosomal protein of 126 kDa n=1 Tax=Perognathus longimembris pacificus TaxID=214514 RepID=UPI0020189C10|nr:centrosomal protein of 126 kDa [Perognathus longimembris pacificus]